MQDSQNEPSSLRFREVSFEEIDAVLAFLPELDDPEAHFGGFRRIGKGKIPAFVSSNLTFRLEETLYRANMIFSFNWPESAGRILSREPES